jgi:hypothetical protein
MGRAHTLREPGSLNPEAYAAFAFFHFAQIFSWVAAILALPQLTLASSVGFRLFPIPSRTAIARSRRLRSKRSFGEDG